MSGFIAIFNTDNTPVDRGLLRHLTMTLRHRGPDRQEIWSEGPVGLGHALFRTTDQAPAAIRPAGEDDRVRIAGSIRLDGRSELGDKLGLQATETQDSTLVLAAYHRWGEDCLAHLLGDFAFAIWDARRGRMFCARDRFGLRQLCFAQRGGTFIASNSIHTLRQHPAVTDTLCEAAIGHFLLFGDHRWADNALTAFADIAALPPANCLVVGGRNRRVRRYWQPGDRPPLLRYRRPEDYLEHFSQVFRTCVADRLPAADITVSLSGGMDSPSIAATIRELQRERVFGAELHAAAILFDSIHDSDEHVYLAAVCAHLGIAPQLIDGGDYPLLSPPIQTTAPIELYQPSLWLDLQRYAASRGRVLITGDAADELFRFSTVKQALRDMSPLRAAAETLRLYRRYGRCPPLGTGLGRRYRRRNDSSTEVLAPYPYPAWLNPDLERQLDLRRRWAAYWQETHSGARLQGDAGTDHIVSSITATDWTTDDVYMDCGFTLPEQRSPFLDTRLLDLARALPALPWLFNKDILRRAMHTRLPQRVLRRPKVPLGAIHASLLARTPRGEGPRHGFSADLARFVDAGRYRCPTAGADSHAETYVNLRPLILDTWIRGLTG